MDLPRHPIHQFVHPAIMYALGLPRKRCTFFPSPSQRIGQILILFGRSTEPFGRQNKKSMLLSATAVRGHHAARVVKNLTSEIPSQLDHCTQQFLPRSNGRKTGSHWQDPSSPSTCIILHCTARCSARQNKSSAMVVCFLRYACRPVSRGVYNRHFTILYNTTEQPKSKQIHTSKLTKL